MIEFPFHRVVVGIDPGLSGAVVRLEAPGGKITAARDFRTRRDITRAVTRLVPGSDAVVIELVHAMPGEGVCSVWSFGKATGTAFGAVEAIHEPELVEVAPQKWQNFFKKLFGIDPKTRFKEVTREIAARLFPKQVDLFKRKKDHGTSDAALIAVWGVLNA
jgi:crossover junction endodeoxyribonuclease RuvC